MKNSLLLAIGCLWFIACNPFQKKISELPNYSDAAIEANYRILPDVEYGSDPKQTMDIYLSKNPDRLGRKNYTIIFIHGGGYYVSDKKAEERYIQPYLRKGLNVVNLNYRLKKGIFTATEDLASALQFLSEQQKTYSLDLDRIVLTGFSAGALMAANIGCWYNEEDSPFALPADVRVQAIINFSGPSHNLDTVEKIFVNWNDDFVVAIGKSFFPPHPNYTKSELVELLEPYNQFDTKDPAFFLWYGGDDNQVPPVTHLKLIPLLESDPDKNQVLYVKDGQHSPNKEQLEAAYQEIWLFLDKL